MAPAGAITDKGRAEVLSFWEYVAFVANSLIFLLIGVRLPHQDFAAVWMPLVVITLLVLLGRVVAVYGCCLPFARSSRRVARNHQHILIWGGFGGALALALVFGLPVAYATAGCHRYHSLWCRRIFRRGPGANHALAAATPGNTAPRSIKSQWVVVSLPPLSLLFSRRHITEGQSTIQKHVHQGPLMVRKGAILVFAGAPFAAPTL